MSARGATRIGLILGGVGILGLILTRLTAAFWIKGPAHRPQPPERSGFHAPRRPGVGGPLL